MEDNKNFVKEITNIDKDFAQWYTDIVIKAELADYTDTKGCIAIRPYGYAIWENIQNYTDKYTSEWIAMYRWDVLRWNFLPVCTNR